MTTTPTSGAADLPEALHVDRSEAVNLARNFTVEDGIVVTQKGVRILADAVLLMDAALTAQAISAEPAGAEYAELPKPYCYEFREPKERYTTDQMRAFADDTHALRASHGQAPAHVLHLVQDAFAEVAMAYPKAFALHKVGLADTAVRKALATPSPQAAQQAPAGATPWRSAVLDLIDECPGLTMEQDRWLSRRVKEIDFASAPRPTAQAAPAAGAVAGSDGRMSDELRSLIEGMSVSVDVSTGDHDAGHRYFGTVTEVMECQGDKHGVTLLVQDAEPNFAPTPAPPADSVLEDAARYRWLREGNDAIHGAAWHVAVNLYGCEWDAAIDAAMNKGGA